MVACSSPATRNARLADHAEYSRHRVGSGTNTGPEDLARAIRDQKILDLRRDGHSLAAIGLAVDLPKSTVHDACERWLRELGPSSERVEELRELQGLQLDALQMDYWPHRMRMLRNEDGEVIYEGPDDNRRPALVPDVQVADRLIRIMERRAKLYGLDLERAASYGATISREMLAEVLELAPAESAPIDVEAEELTSASEQESGADSR
jgi:hypothetical protein